MQAIKATGKVVGILLRSTFVLFIRTGNRPPDESEIPRNLCGLGAIRSVDGKPMTLLIAVLLLMTSVAVGEVRTKNLEDLYESAADCIAATKVTKPGWSDKRVELSCKNKGIHTYSRSPAGCLNTNRKVWSVWSCKLIDATNMPASKTHTPATLKPVLTSARDLVKLFTTSKRASTGADFVNVKRSGSGLLVTGSYGTCAIGAGGASCNPSNKTTLVVGADGVFVNGTRNIRVCVTYGSGPAVGSCRQYATRSVNFTNKLSWN